MAFQWWFNGQDMSKYLETNSVERNIGQNRKASLQKLGISSGKRFQYTSADEGKVTVSFLIRRDMVAKRREIAGLLSSNEPQQLIFGDEPDKYYLAIADDQISLSEKFRHGNGEVTFIVPDGVAHSLTTSTVSGQSGTDITVTNAGTAPTSPLLTATMSGDNGLVGFAADTGGALMFGSPDEIDGDEKQRSEQVYHYTFDSEPTGVTLNDGAIAFPLFNGNPSTPNTQSGPFKYANGVAQAASQRTADMKWNGPSMSGKLPLNSAGKATGNFEWHNRIKFSTNPAANGRTEFNLSSGGNVVISLLLYDNSLTQDMLMFEGTVGDQHLFLDNLPRSYYKNGEYDMVVAKMGDKITFRLDRIGLGGGGIEVRTVDGLADMAIDGWTAWFTGFSNTEGWSFGWEDSYFNWINVDYWNDLPNRFKAGDVVTVDVYNHTVAVNGAEDPTLQVIGNDWKEFVLPPGNTVIHPIASTWATPFDCTITWREAWL